MTNSQMSARVGLFFLLGVVLIYVVFESLTAGKISRNNGYPIVAHFNNLKELKKGDDVRMAGVRIGAIGQTRLVGRHAEAVLLIDKNIKIAKDSTAVIAMTSLLGSNYIALDLGTEQAGFLNEGDRIKALDTADLNTLFTQLGDIGKKIDSALGNFSGALNGTGPDGQPGQGGLLGKIDKLVDENRTKIGNITGSLEEITAKVNKGDGTLGRLVNDPKLHDELLASVKEIKVAATEAKNFVTSAQGMVDQVKSGQGTLGVLLYDKDAGNNVKLTLQNARDISDKLNKGQGTLGKLLNDDSLFNQASGSLKKLDRALDSMADQGPISAVGVTANALF